MYAGVLYRVSMTIWLSSHFGQIFTRCFSFKQTIQPVLEPLANSSKIIGQDIKLLQVDEQNNFS